MTFKVGDKVVATKDYGSKLTEGRLYTIESIQGRYFRVRDDLGGIDGWPAEYWVLPEGPVRTVTRRVIVPGLYGIVAVYRVQDQVRVTLTREDSTPDQLEAAARTLQQLAEALRVLTNES